MLRLTAIFIAICVVLIAASVGAVGYLVFGLSGSEATMIALVALTALALYNMISARLRDRNAVSTQIADLSRGTADLARQVAELGRQVIAIEQQDATRRARQPADPLAVEIGELGVLVKELAEAVATQDTRLTEIASLVETGQAEASRAEANPAGAAAPASVSAPASRPKAVPEPVAAKAEAAASGPFKGKSADEIAAMIRDAVEDNRIDLYLQPVVTLPQRKVRYYEAMTRLRTEDGTLILPSDFLSHAEKAGLIGRIDNTQMFRCVQVLRRLLLKNREIGLFCNISALTLNDADVYRQFFDFLEANRALSSSLTLEFSQEALRAMGPLEQETLASLIALGFRFSMDRVTDLRLGPRDLSDLGVRFVKVPAHLLLSKNALPADIHAADLSDLLGRHGISLIAERIETEAVVVDLLDYDVRYGQGFLFSPPRPVRADALAGASAREEMGRPALGETPHATITARAAS
jgi:cyclic-di-GMP phosphodiesterase TipF (flagellum assembly factor)